MADRISLLLINLALVAYLVLWLAGIVQAQPNSVGLTATFGTGSAASGNTSSLGACVEGTHDLAGYAVLTGSGCYDSGNKGYVGDGRNLRARAEVHGYFTRDIDRIRPFVLGGINWVQQSNSQYTKAITNYYFGGGVNFRNRVIVQAEYLLPERGTLNQVSALRFGGYWLRPVAPKWSLKLGGEVTSTRFYQPGGPLSGWHRATSATITGGILRTNNERREASVPPILIPPPKPRTQYAAVQSYTTGYGDYRIVNPL